MKNNILIPFVGDSIGGSHKSIIEIYNNLKNMNINIIFVLHKKNGILSKYLKKLNINYKILEIKNLAGESPSKMDIVLSNLKFFFKLYFFIKRNKITLIHCNDLRTNLSWTMAAKISRTPLIWHQRTLMSKSKWWNFVKYISNEFIVTSNSIKKSSPKNIKNTKLIHNPVNEIFEVKQKNKKINSKFIDIGYCGRIVKSKNIEYLIESVANIDKNKKIKDKKIRLYLAGNGSNEYINILKKFSLKNGFKNIYFLGFIENPYKFIEKLDLLVCPSLIDGFGRTLIESMVVKTPVIASKVGGHRDIIRNNYNGVLFNPNKKRSLEAKIVSLVSNNKLKNRIISNYSNTLIKYNKNLIAEKIFKIYEKYHSKEQLDKLTKTLHIDIEGGWGGSSKSLFEIIKVVNKKVTISHVILGQSGKISKEYNKLGIKNLIIKNLYSFVPRKKNSHKIFIKNLYKLIVFFKTFSKILKYIKNEKIEIIHLNYEGLFLYGLFLKLFTNKKIIIHIRTLLPMKNIYSKIIIKLIKNYCADYILFISDNEKKRFNFEQTKYTPHNEILLNIYNTNYLANKQKRGRYKIIYLGNINYNKGVDRLLDLSEFLIKNNLDYFTIDIYGIPRENFAFYDNLLKIKNERNLYNLDFKGHIFDVSKVLKNAFLLIRPSRDNDPWGRDVIEAITSGLPVIATGSYNKLVINNSNGFLVKNFNCAKIANYCEYLRKNPDKWEKFSKYSIKNLKPKFNGLNQYKVFKNIIYKLNFNV